MGVPMSVASADHDRLPTNAFRRPPSLPGGGVISVNSHELESADAEAHGLEQDPRQPEEAERHRRQGRA